MTVKKTENKSETKVDIKDSEANKEIASLKKDMDLLKSELTEVKSKLNGKYLYGEVKKYEIRNSYKNI